MNLTSRLDYRDLVTYIGYLGSSWLYVDTCVLMAQLHTKVGDFQEASVLLTKTIELSEQLGYKKGTFEAMKTFAALDFEQENWSLALPMFKECLRMKDMLKKGEEPLILSQIALCYQGDKQPLKSLKFYELALQLYKKQGDSEYKNEIESIEKNIGTIKQSQK